MKSINRRRRHRLAAMGVALAVVAAACGDDDEPSSATATAAESTASPATAGAPDTAAATETSTAATTTGDAATTVLETTAPTDIAAPDTVTISLSGGGQGLFAAFFAAQEGSLADLAEASGFDIEVFNAGSGSDAMAAFTGGSAQLCLCGPSRALAAVEAGEDVVGVFSSFVGNATLLIGAKGYEDTLGTDPAAYADKVWGYSSEGGLQALTAQAVATGVGLDWESVQRLAYGDIAAAIPSLESGQVDLAAMDPVSATSALALDVGYVVENMLEAGDVISSTLFINRSFIEEYPDLVQAVVNALVQALAEVQAASTAAEVLAMTTSEYQETNNDPAMWDAQWALVRPAIALTDGGYTPELIEKTLLDAQSTGAVTEVTDELRAVFTNEYVDAAYEILGIPRPS